MWAPNEGRIMTMMVVEPSENNRYMGTGQNPGTPGEHQNSW